MVTRPKARTGRSAGQIRAGFLRVLIALGVLGVLYAARQVSYLLFHVLVEVFFAVVAGAIFIIAWHSRRFFREAYFVLVAGGAGFVAALGSVHLLAYEGMNALPGGGANAATQLWIASRYALALTLLIAPAMLGRSLRLASVACAYATAAALVLLSVFVWRIFPDCFIERGGLTPFKVISEYLIFAMLLGAGAFLYARRNRLAYPVWALMLGMILTSAIGEFLFTLYRTPFDTANLLGHYAILVSFYLLYRALIVTALEHPFSLLFRDLKAAEESLRGQRDRLEACVAERTAELTRSNQLLREEIEQRTRRQKREEFTLRLLESFSACKTRPQYLARVLELMRNWVGCRCGGIRVLDSRGEAVYEARVGLSDDFFRQEGCLRPADACICTRLLSEQLSEAERACATPWGSFRCDDVRAFWEGLTTQQRERCRDACFREGFGSLAMIPIRYQGRMLGMVHLADARAGAISAEQVEFLESLAVLIGEAMYRFGVEEELRTSRERLFAVLQALPALVIIRSRTGAIPFANKQFVERFGRPLDRPCYSLIAGRETPCEDCFVRDVFQTDSPRQTDRVRCDGRSYHCWAYPFHDGDGERVLEVAVDMTDRKQLEKEVLIASETEKRRIGQDLHESLCQTLSGLSCVSRVLQQRLALRGLNDEAAQAAQLEQEIAKSVQMARSLAQGLILVGDGPESLMYWIRNLAASLEQLFSIRCRFICPEPVAIADSLTATHLYHICQEAAHNAIRHGRAKNISLRLENTEDAVILSVEDDGAGLPRQAPPAEGMGLKVMKHRCDAIGASFAIGPAVSGGAVVTCRLPRAYDPAKEGTP